MGGKYVDVDVDVRYGVDERQADETARRGYAAVTDQAESRPLHAAH